MSGKALILLRTHFVDARIEALARAYAAGGDYDVSIALDESAGEIDSRGFRKLSMSLNSCVRLGLEVGFDNPFWRCGDYLFYHALAEAPTYERYWSIEYDIVLNAADPLDLLRELDARAREDYLTTFLAEADPGWVWRSATARRFPVVYASGFALVRLTRGAASSLWARRRYERERLRATSLEPQAHWPNDEAFVSSAAPDLGHSMADVNAYGTFYTPDTLRREGVWHPDEIPPADGRVYHAVRTGGAYLAAARSYYRYDVARFFRFAERDADAFAAVATEVIVRHLQPFADEPAALFDPDGPLAPLAEPLRDARVAAVLMAALARRRFRLCVEALQFGRVTFEIARTPAHDNVALARPAWQSSRSARSRARSAREDAEFGNDGDTACEYGFHTGFEQEPWWAVDFGAEHALARVRLHNRIHAEGRLKAFVVEVSHDGVGWRTLHAHDPADLRALRARPIEIEAGGAVARYLRVRLARQGVLHLVEVEAIRVV